MLLWVVLQCILRRLFWYKNKYNLNIKSKKGKKILFLLLLWDYLLPVFLVSIFEESILSAFRSQKTIEAFALLSIAVGLFLTHLIFSYKDAKNYLEKK